MSDDALRETLEPRDRPQIEELLKATDFFRPDEIVVALEVFDEFLARGDASGYHFLVLDTSPDQNPDQDPTDGPRIEGYSCYGPIPLTLGSWDLYWIAVDPNQQGRGLGRRLVGETEVRAARRGARKLFIETSGRPLYTPTREFYLRCGYRVAAQLQDFYAPGDDKVIFVRDLGDVHAGG